MLNIHLIGIGGAGLSAIATVLLQQGYVVSGSDMQASPATERLARLGATIFIGHRAENLDMDDRRSTIDMVVVSSAISPDNSELVEARRRGLPVFKRAEWLGRMMQAQVGIAIAGTHGKTTTTAMTAFILHEAGHDPTYIVGGFIPQLDTNAAAGQGAAFVIEADEYDHTFLGLRPAVTVVTTVEWDHPDIFPTPQAVYDAFEKFIQLTPEDGLVIGCGDDVGVRAVINGARAKLVTYGLQPHNQWQAVDIRPNQRGGCDFRVRRDNTAADQAVAVSLAVPGRHNVCNALAALVVADHQNLELAQAAQLLSQFKGVARRFEIKGEIDGLIVIDDYAHHPTEVKTTLAAARARFGNQPLWLAFQPHTFSRTLALLDDFTDAFDQADHVIIVDIFASREIDTGLIKSQDLVKRMKHPDARYIGSLSAAADYLATQLIPPAVLLTMGAGDGYKIGEWVLEKLRKRET